MQNFNRALIGRVTIKQIETVVKTQSEYTQLGIHKFGINSQSSLEELEDLKIFIRNAVVTEINKEIQRLHAKTLKQGSPYINTVHYTKYIKWAEKMVDETMFERLELDIKREGSDSNPTNWNLEKWQKELAGNWLPLATKPAPPLITISPRDAEIHCCQIMLFLGAVGAKITQYSQDGGIDVEADNYIAQVKHQAAPVGVKVIRETFGVASYKNKAAVVFARSGFTNESISFATNNGVFLIEYGLGITPWTVASNVAVKNGLDSALSYIPQTQPESDANRAISWKKITGYLDRENTP